MKPKILFLFIMSFFLLFSCSSKQTSNDKNSYYVFGKKYTTINSSQNFSQKGIASWYGKKFHGRKTANGETYNMHDMTCAHKTLPFNTKLEVKNLSNGKKTVVRVNDRGPFVNRRIIDLSYKAAGKLGIDITGTAPVVIKAVDGLTEKEYISGKFTVQTGAFTSRENAVRLKNKLSSDFNHVFIKKVYKNNQTFFRVRAGKFTSLKQAELSELKLRQNGYPNAFSVALD